MEFVPLALACGHHAEGFLTFRWGPETGHDRYSEVECPEGCGWQRWVSEPDLAEVES